MRRFLRELAGLTYFFICDLRIVGRENLPPTGPAILVANHFHYSDPVAIMRLSRRQVEFIGGFRFFVGPKYLHFLPRLWGYIPAFRGGYSRRTLDAALSVLNSGGVIAIFPEGGAWASVLRPARRGAAYLALESQVPVIPVGLDGFDALFRTWRPRITIRVGKPIGPFRTEDGARRRRAQIDEIGEAIMRSIATLIPRERHGVFSDDPRLRAEAEKVADFPFEKEGMRGL